MRSSIACLRCRKSKIKCDNDEGRSPCETCIKTGKDCKYPEASPLPPKRSDPPSGSKGEREGGPDRKRVKKLDEGIRLDIECTGALYAEEVLSAHYLTEELWDQLFSIYKLHFATELHFLHPPSLKERKWQKKATTREESEINLVLLGVLTLTACFHSDLVKYVTHSRLAHTSHARARPAQTAPDAAAASEYFADALTKALGPLRTCMGLVSVERVQAFLMLGLYEWNQARGTGAWMYVGVAIRMAQALALGFGDKAGRVRDVRRQIPSGTTRVPSEISTYREIQRRTMFSCLILDRLLACGSERVSTIRSEDLQIRLPCSEVAFDLSLEVQTGYLKPPRSTIARPISDDSVLGRFIRLVDIWGDLSKFSYAGGRLTEKHPPWNEETTFRQLRERLDSFYSALPETFAFSKSNFYKHDNHHASSVWVSMHMLGSLCQIMLHREYIPFIPIRCSSPTGPLDEPTFPADRYPAPSKFWESSAEQVFRSAKDVVTLIEISQRSNKLPLSALVVFTIWTTAFVGIYALHFPHMDQKGHMLLAGRDGDDETNSPVEGASDPTTVAYQTLRRASSKFKLAAKFASRFSYWDGFFRDVWDDYHKAAPHNRRYSTEGQLSIRLGGVGGGLDEWKREGPKITDNGSILSRDEKPDSDRSRASSIDPPSSIGLESHNSVTRTPRSTPSGTFTAINSMPAHTPAPLDVHATSDSRHDGLPVIEIASKAPIAPPSCNKAPQALEQQHQPSASSLRPHIIATAPEQEATMASGKHWEEYENASWLGMTNDIPDFTQGSDLYLGTSMWPDHRGQFAFGDGPALPNQASFSPL